MIAAVSLGADPAVAAQAPVDHPVEIAMSAEEDIALRGLRLETRDDFGDAAGGWADGRSVRQ